MATRGRKPKLTPEVFELIERYLKQGNYLNTAAAAAGVRRETLHAWLKAGANQPSGPFREFCDMVERATAEGQRLHVETIHEARTRDWKASRFFLTHRFRDDFAQSIRQEHTGNGGAPLAGPLNLKALTDDELAELERLVRKASDAARTGSGGDEEELPALRSGGLEDH